MNREPERGTRTRNTEPGTGTCAAAVLAGIVLIAGFAAGCTRERVNAASSSATPDWFTDRAAETGLDFVHVNGMSGRRYMAEIVGPGVALFDYDNDGDLDVFFAQGGSLEKGPPEGGPHDSRDVGAAFRRPGKAGGRLYRNDLTVGSNGVRHLHFTDVTAESGIVTLGYGMGVAIGDIDNDGCVDLYTTNVGRNQLFRNNCDGTFTDVSGESLTDLDGWSVPAAFIDYDRDGWLDLFVGRYLRWRPEQDIQCAGPTGMPDYCSPRSYPAAPAVLYHNNRNGTFTDVTASAGMSGAHGPALGAVTMDADGDGWLDLFVANDGVEDQLWLNLHDGTFRDVGVERGVALTSAGRAESSMGVDAADIDNDGDEDLVVTEQAGEGHNLFVNDGRGRFDDRSDVSGIGPASLGYTGFGAAWLDIDNDGALDLFSVNGAVQTIQRLAQAHDPFPLHQAKQLFRRRADGRFEDVTALAGAALQVSDVSRGAAFGDIDNDGDVDVVIANNNGPARLLLNNVGSRHHWVGIRAVGERHQRDMLGARVEIRTHDGPRMRRVRTDGSYAAARDPRILVGLGEAATPVTVRIEWPDGRTTTRDNVQVDRYTTIAEDR
jgi:hypothetical protein